MFDFSGPNVMALGVARGCIEHKATLSFEVPGRIGDRAWGHDHGDMLGAALGDADGGP